MRCGSVRCGSVQLVRFGAVGAVRSAYYRLCAHARSCARLGFGTWLIVAMWKEAPARHKIMRTPSCVLRENMPSFDQSIDTTLPESTCEEVGQDLVSKLWFSAPGPNRTAPHRTVPHRTELYLQYRTKQFARGSVMVRSWYA